MDAEVCGVRAKAIAGSGEEESEVDIQRHIGVWCLCGSSCEHRHSGGRCLWGCACRTDTEAGDVCENAALAQS